MFLSRGLHRRSHLCLNCTRHISKVSVRSLHSNGRHRRLLKTPPSRPLIALRTFPVYQLSLARSSHAYNTATTSRRHPRIAIIGSGPAGFYTAHRLLNKVQDAGIDMYEQLPVPYGLVRFGVAPDHPEVKNCQDTFEEVAQSPRFTYIGNVRVGHDIDLSQMKPHYDAILFSYGASEDKRLGILGEDLQGVYSARDFVGWYNGLPKFQHLAPDLEAGEQAVVIGQGNVALDVARILLAPVKQLLSTDITDQALQTLAKSKIKSVRVVGRRGPLQAAFTVKEARELMHLDQVAFEPIDAFLYPPEVKKLPRVQKRIAEVLLKGTALDYKETPRTWALDFFKAPISMNANSGRLSSITFSHQELDSNTNPLSKTAPVVATDETSTMEASIAFRSVGYKSKALGGLSDLGVPFDTKLGIISNDMYGRVLSPSVGPGDLTAGHVPGLYCAGWVKRGPTGVIASTMQDAFTSADIIAEDWNANVPFLNHDSSGVNQATGQGWDGVKEEVIRKGVRPLSWKDWKTIDKVEKEKGKERGNQREKFTSIQDMLAVLDA